MRVQRPPEDGVCNERATDVDGEIQGPQTLDRSRYSRPRAHACSSRIRV